MRKTDAEFLDRGYESNKVSVEKEADTFTLYHYDGFVNDCNGEKLAPFPEMVRYEDASGDIFESFDATIAEAKGLTPREIFEGDSNTNRLLYSTVIDAPEGLIASDPGHLEEGSRVNIEPGPWEVTFKGFHGISQASLNLHLDPYDPNEPEKYLQFVMNCFVPHSYRPRTSTIWVVRPGTEFSTVSEKPVFRIDIDAGMIGVFPPEKNRIIPRWDVEDNPFLALATGAKDLTDPIYVHERGLFSGTVMGDLTCSAYSLHNHDGEKVGYVITTSFHFEEDEDIDVEWEQEEKDEFEASAAELIAKYSDRGLTLNSSLRDSSNSITGTIDGMKFSLLNTNRAYRLRVGVTDLDYRQKVIEGVKKRNLTQGGKPYQPNFEDSYPERQLYESIKEGYPVYGKELLSLLDELLATDFTPVPEGFQLF